MINMIQNAKDQAAALAMNAYQAAVADGTLPQADVKTAPVEIPKDTANGDFTTTFALAASKALRQPPRNIAQALLDHMDLKGTYFASAEIAGPGFLNFRLDPVWLRDVMAAVESEGDQYYKEQERALLRGLYPGAQVEDVGPLGQFSLMAREKENIALIRAFVRGL